MNRNQIREQKEKEAKINKQLQADELRADIERKAEICRKFTSDKRHAEFKSLFDDIIFNQRFKQLLDLADSAQSLEEWSFKSFKLVKEMKDIKNIFYKPKVFIENENKIQGDK
jgi:hypothetical protein